MTTQANVKVRYFNIHTEATGYINSLKEIPGDRGNFWVSTFCALEGHPDNPEKLYIDFTVPGQDALSVLTPYQDAIKADTKVFAVVRYANLRAVPFVYPQSSANAGQLGVSYSAKLIKVLYLKVGDQVVFDHRDSNAQQPAQSAPSSQPQRPAVQQQAKTAPAASADEPLFTPPLTVELSKNDPRFNETRDRLKQDGYGWNSELGLWTLKAVKLEKENPRFNEQLSTVKELGYRWDKDSSSWKQSFHRKTGTSMGKPQHSKPAYGAQQYAQH